MRIFISVDMSKEIQEEIKKIQEKLPEFKGKKTEPENLHLTLKFFGEVSEKKVEKIKEKLRKVKYNSFGTEIDVFGVFSQKFVKIIWLHLKNCEGLQEKIDDSLKNLFKPERRFMSHLTIARVKKVKNRKKFLEELQRIKLPEINFKVENFRLKKSELKPDGPKYKIIEEYILD